MNINRIMNSLRLLKYSRGPILERKDNSKNIPKKIMKSNILLKKNDVIESEISKKIL